MFCEERIARFDIVNSAEKSKSKCYDKFTSLKVKKFRVRLCHRSTEVIVRVRVMVRLRTRVKLWLEVRARVRPRYKQQVCDGPP